jgi:phage repressor protein C with HTH and peptisase S24 domain
MSQSGCSSEGLEPFALRVIGDSMSPVFEDGNIIIVDPGYPLINDTYAVLVNNEEVLFGHYLKDENGCRLEYMHPDHPPVMLADNFSVKGIVTQRNARRRKDTVYFDYPLNSKG